MVENGNATEHLPVFNTDFNKLVHKCDWVRPQVSLLPSPSPGTEFPAQGAIQVQEG